MLTGPYVPVFLMRDADDSLQTNGPEATDPAVSIAGGVRLTSVCKVRKCLVSTVLRDLSIRFAVMSFVFSRGDMSCVAETAGGDPLFTVAATGP